LQSGVNHLQNKKISAVAQKSITDYQDINSGIKKYASAHRDFQSPEINTLNAVDISESYGTQWDQAWLRKVISDQDSLLVMVNKSFPSITDSILLQTLNNELPKIRSDLDKLKQLE
jgi:hypothetical protein